MSNCKLCALLPNEELQDALLSKSERYIAAHFPIGKTTVNKHRRKCMGVYVPATTNAKMEENELQEVIWNGNNGELRTGTLSQALADVSHESILEMFGYNSDEVSIIGTLREKHSQYWSRDLGEMLWKHSYSFGVIRNEPKPTEQVDPIALLKELGFQPQPKPANTNSGKESTWVLDWADWQVCKAEGGEPKAF